MNDLPGMARILYRQAVMIFFSMIFSVFIYGGVCYVAIRAGRPAGVVIQGEIYRLFQIGAFILAVLAILGSRRLAKKILGRESSQVPGTIARHPRQIFNAEIVRCTAAELPAVFGVVLIFLSRDFLGFIPFAVLAFSALVFSFPRKENWTTWLGTDF